MQMAVRGNWLDVELLPPVRAVAVTEQAQILEHVERPVDRGWDGSRVNFPAALDELGAGDVTVGSRQHLDERPPLRRPAQAAGAQLIAHLRPVRDGPRAD